MFKLKKMRFGNVGRFVTPQEIDYTKKGQLVQIDGKFEDTGGSSGSGKSTFIEVADWVLGVNKTPTTLLQSRYTKESMWGELECESLDTLYLIKRGKSGLSIKWDTGEISGNNAKAEEKILELLGVEPELFRKMTHKAQKEDGFFLSLTPKESFNFLIKVMGMEKMLGKIERSEAKVSLYEGQVIALQSEMSSLGPKYNDQLAIIKKLEAEPLPAKPDYEELAKLSENAIKMMSDLKSIQDSEQQQITEVKKLELSKPEVWAMPPRLQEIDFEIKKLETEAKQLEQVKSDKLNQIQKALDGLKSQKTSCEYAGRKISEYISSIINKEKELSHLTDRQCPTCLQRWVGLDLEAKIDSLRSDIESLKVKSVEAEAEKAKIPDLSEKISRTEGIVSNLSSSSPSTETYKAAAVLKTEKDAILAKFNLDKETSLKEYAETNKKITNHIEQIRNNFETIKTVKSLELSNLKLNISKLELAEGEWKNALTARDNNLRINKEYLNKYELELAAKNSEYQEAQSQYLLYSEVRRLLKSYTNRSFESALETIGKSATERLNKIPNMATATIQFESFKEIKGKIKEEVNVVLSMDGDVGVSIKTLSGGERSAADLAVDLAVADFIQEQAGIGANYLILDEPLSGMDSVCKQEYIEMLKTISTEKQIFIVEHSNEVKEMVSDKITIVRRGLYSNVEA